MLFSCTSGNSYLFHSKISLIFRRLFISRTYKQLYAMNVVYFRLQPDDSQFQINFHYKDDDQNIDRPFNFSRNVTETVAACTERIRANVEKEILKKSRKKKLKGQKKCDENVDVPIPVVPEKVVISIIKDQVPVDGSIRMVDLFPVYTNLRIQICSQLFSVAFNHPWVDSVTLPTSLLAGCYVYPAKIETQCCNMNETKLVWFKGMEVKSKKEEDIQWIKIGEDFLYLLMVADVGHRIKLICTPKNSSLTGPSVECISKCLVEAGPGPCPFETRHCFTSHHLSGKQFRVMSYNILADLYADSEYSRTVLFPYCPPYALAIDYRKQLFTREILGYKSDVICLQEVDSKIFDLDLEPLFKIAGYTGTFQKKGQTAEGLATFFNQERFELIERYGITIGENIPKLTIFDDLWQKIQSNEKLVERIVDRSTALQVTVIRSIETEKFLIVANTHLYFHPDADHVRLLQIGLAMEYVRFVYEKTKNDKNLDDRELSIIFCGDFNSVPECGIYKLMTERFVPDDFIDFQSNQEEAVKGVSLQQPFSFQSAYKDLKYTNFTPLFTAWLDYIFYQTDNLRVNQVIPMPSHEEVSLQSGIPSVVFPSDHLALIADLEWT